LEELPGVSQVQVDLSSGRVTFESDNPVSQEDLARIIKSAGYELAPAQ